MSIAQADHDYATHASYDDVQRSVESSFGQLQKTHRDFNRLYHYLNGSSMFCIDMSLVSPRRVSDRLT